MFFKLLLQDLRQGLFREWKKLLCFLFVIFLASVELHRKFGLALSGRRIPEGWALEGSHLTLGDYLLFPVAGMKEYIPRPGYPFDFPMRWLLFFLLVFFAVLYYPYNDLAGSGKNVVVLSRSRGLWWFSKCAWCVLSVCFYFLLSWGEAFLFALFSGADLSFTITENMGYFLDLQVPDIFGPPEQVAGMAMLLPLLVAVSLALLQLTLSLFLKPLFSFACIAALLLASAYYQSPFLIGNYGMPVRCSLWIGSSLTPALGVALCAGVSLVSVILGWAYFRRMDILNKE